MLQLCVGEAILHTHGQLIPHQPVRAQGKRLFPVVDVFTGRGRLGKGPRGRLRQEGAHATLDAGIHGKRSRNWGSSLIVLGVFDGAIGVLCSMPNAIQSADERAPKISRRIARNSVLPRAWSPY